MLLNVWLFIRDFCNFCPVKAKSISEDLDICSDISVEMGFETPGLFLELVVHPNWVTGHHGGDQEPSGQSNRASRVLRDARVWAFVLMMVLLVADDWSHSSNTVVSVDLTLGVVCTADKWG